MDRLHENLLQIGRQGLEPCLVENPDEQALGVVDLGEELGVLELLGDVAHHGSVIQTVDGARLHGHGHVRPGHHHRVHTPGVVCELVDLGLGDAELDLPGLLQGPDRDLGGPAVIAVAGDVQAHDALVLHGIHEMIEHLLVGDELVQFLERVDQIGQIDHAETGAEVGGGDRTDRHALNGAHLQLIEHLYLSAQDGEGFVVEVNLAVGALPELVADGKPGEDPFDGRRGYVGYDRFVLGAGRIERRLPGIHRRCLLLGQNRPDEQGEKNKTSQSQKQRFVHFHPCLLFLPLVNKLRSFVKVCLTAIKQLTRSLSREKAGS